MGLHFSVDLQAEGAKRVEQPGPFRVLVLGDFSGQEAQGSPVGQPAALGRPQRVDRDNLEALLARLAPALRFDSLAGAPAGEISFRSLDDFLPERVAARVAPLAQLIELRRRLHDPATFEAAAEVVRSWEPEAPGATGTMVDVPGAQAGQAGPGSAAPPAHKGAMEGEAPSTPAGQLPPGKSLLDVLISSTEAQQTATPMQGEPAPGAGRPGSMLERAVRQMVQQAVAGQQVAPPPKDLAALAARLDARLGPLLRAAMHAPQFRKLEALWRGLDWLVRRLDDETCQVHVLDATPRQLAADLRSSTDQAATQLGRLLVDEVQGQPFWLAAACYEFAANREDLELLGRLAMLGQQARTPLVAAAAHALVGCTDAALAAEPQRWHSIAKSSLADAWRVLRSLPAARYAALVFPGFAVRQPYQDHPLGAGAAFNELEGAGEMHRLLWANPAFAFAALAAEAFRLSGPRFTLNGGRLESLPVAVLSQGSQREQLPCAEFWLGERAVRSLQELGIVPLVPIRHSDAVLLPTLDSLAEPAAPLAGRWLG